MTETIGITFNFDEWEQKYAENDFAQSLNQLKSYATGFLLVPSALYEGQVVLAKTFATTGDNFDEIVNFVKDLHQKNKKVFLYEIFHQDMVDNNKFYKLRYAELDDQKPNSNVKRTYLGRD